MPNTTSQKEVASKLPTRQQRPSVHLSRTVSGFRDFLREYGVVALAVGFVFGAQVKTVVDSFIAGFVNPIVGILLPGKGALDQKTFIFHHDGKMTTFAWGSFVSSVLSFVIIAFIIYATVKLLKLDKLKPKAGV